MSRKTTANPTSRRAAPLPMPSATPPWMWLVRESFPHLPPIIAALARALLALLLGGASLVLALQGRVLPTELLRVLPR